MRTRMKEVCWRAVRTVALVSGMMMMVTGCRIDWGGLPPPLPPPDDYFDRADYTNTLEVVAATVGDYTYTYVVTNGDAMITGPTRIFKLRGEHFRTLYALAILPEPTGVFSIPATLDGYPVTSIGERVFAWHLKLKRVIIPSSVTSIGDYAFMVCTSLASVEIPSNVTSIGRYAFWGCKKLKSVEIQSGVTSIGEGAFKGCTSLKSVTIASSVTSIGGYAFRDCTRLKRVIIPKGAIVERGAFPEDCQILRE